ncbi:MAG: 3-oxoadipate enol-lactonase [Janthinobacterium lividum]
MPNATINGTTLHYQVDGPETGDWLVLSNSLGTNLNLWSGQLATFSRRFRVLRYDTRGHGQSAVPAGPYTIAQLSGDVIGLMDQLGIERAHFCGISMGGLTGIALGARYAARIDRLVLCNTAALIGSAEIWTPRAERARREGMEVLAAPVLERWLTPAFREREPAALAALRATLVATSGDGYAANCEAIRDADLRDETAAIKAPTLVIAGTHDLAATPEQGLWLADHIAGARYLELDASHISNVEQADAFNRAVLAFLTE